MDYRQGLMFETLFEVSKLNKIIFVSVIIDNKQCSRDSNCASGFCHPTDTTCTPGKYVASMLLLPNFAC